MTQTIDGATSANNDVSPKLKQASLAHRGRPRNRATAAARRAVKDKERRQRFPELVFCRFADLKAWGIADNYQQLYNLIDTAGFPAGILMGGRNTRAFPLNGPDGVQAWLQRQPVARRGTPHRVAAAKAEPEEN